MVRAYLKTRGTKIYQMWCPNCEEWEDDSEWTSHEVYEHGEYDQISVSDSDAFFFDSDCSHTTIYSHDNCGEYFSSVDRAESNWICGACDTAHPDRELARACCE